MQLLDVSDDILHSKTELFDFYKWPIDIREKSKEMYNFMMSNNGIGLAANQVGLPYSFFVMRGETPIVCINPIITAYSEDTIVLDEGCLSYPELFLKIKRPKSIRVRYQGIDAIWSVHQYSGMTSRVFQHEYDHLQGVDFMSKVGPVALRRGKDRARKTNKKKNK